MPLRMLPGVVDAKIEQVLCIYLFRPDAFPLGNPKGPSSSIPHDRAFCALSNLHDTSAANEKQSGHC